jgi:hypothetical protein
MQEYMAHVEELDHDLRYFPLYLPGSRTDLGTEGNTFCHESNISPTKTARSIQQQAAKSDFHDVDGSEGCKS